VSHADYLRSWDLLCDKFSFDRFGTVTGQAPIQVLRSIHTGVTIYLHVTGGISGNPTTHEGDDAGLLASRERRGGYTEEYVCAWLAAYPSDEGIAGQTLRRLINVGLAL